MLGYEEWLRETQGEVQEAIAFAENEGWHHEQTSRPDRFAHYQSLLRWEDALNERREWYAEAKRRGSPLH